MLFDDPRPAAPFVPDRAAALEAVRLLTDFGADAGAAAQAHADVSRNRGNVIGFCRWRQIERLIAAMTADGADRTRH